jgi:hypothetical protein
MVLIHNGKIVWIYADGPAIYPFDDVAGAGGNENSNPWSLEWIFG